MAKTYSIRGLRTEIKVALVQLAKDAYIRSLAYGKNHGDRYLVLKEAINSEDILTLTEYQTAQVLLQNNYTFLREIQAVVDTNQKLGVFYELGD